MRFEPGQPDHRSFVAYGLADIPDPRDEVVESYVKGVRDGGPAAVAKALSEVSESGRRVLRVYGERSASRAVRDRTVDLLVSALVAVVIGGLDQNALEAMMPMALIEDAGRRIGADPGVFFGTAANIVGHPASVNLMVWLTRHDEDRTPEAMGFIAAQDRSGFRYKWST
ncbi:MAG TPA: hypothetical protein VNU19_07570 [Candidatus Acidoferrum sp.]|jgi:hypothetical protein|nr:hypothetical protein [Candidatus Acidoferrum sp.]